MKRKIVLAVTLMLAVGFAGSVAAGPFDDGEAASKRGDTPTHAGAPQEQTLVPRGKEKPSFNCAQAKTAAARLICADAKLARLDGELGVVFQRRKAQLSSPDQSTLVAEQLSWIRDRNARCELLGKNTAIIEVLASSKPCMVSAIQERIAYLARIDATAAPAVTGGQPLGPLQLGPPPIASPGQARANAAPPQAERPGAGTLKDAEAAFKHGDYATALRLFRPFADQGSADAQRHLGIMYATGHGAPQDYATAMSWFRKAADQGDTWAQSTLGTIYEAGQGVPQDYAAAASWYRKAAAQGDVYAQGVLGDMYAAGQGVPQDYAAAASWYRKAADQGDVDAQGMLGDMYAAGKGVPQDYAAAASWYRKAADQGNAFAQSNLGSMYARGRGVAQDVAASMSWYRKAADQGNASAQHFLGVMYRDGHMQDYVIAHMWLSLAAARGKEGAARDRDIVAASMTPPQLAEAQKRAAEWRPKIANALPPQAGRAGAGTLGSADAAADKLTAEILVRAGLREQAVGSFLCRVNDAFEDCLEFQEKRKAQCRSKIGTIDERSWCVTSAAVEHFCASLPNQLDRETCTSLQSAWADVFSKNREGVLGVPAGPAQASSRGVPLKMDGGILVVPVEINGTMKLDFVIDSGAADVSVPADVVSTLKRAGTIKESDFIGQRTYILADGSKSQSVTFMIRSLRVGDMVVENVRGSVASTQGSLLLGQSFLERFKSWSIDNTKHELLLLRR